MGNRIKAPTKSESRVIKFMILLGIFSILNFLYFFFQAEHIGDRFLFSLLTITILYSILKKLYMWYNYSNISIPKKPKGTPDFTVDILTTYYPGEPYQMTITTLDAIQNITYPHTAYLCDEANDPYLKKFCEENGIVHVTRDHRTNAKAGNINNALKTKATGDICVVLDPDHIPEPNFLDPILPHFINPEIGFVQIVQSYYNIKETLVARGAAEQTFQFYGPMMMTLNSYGAVNAIGANCVFRREALDSIGGHAPGLCEDMHTAMLLYSKGWKAVYLPEVLARGLAPSNLTNFFKQQLKWSRGTFDLLVKVYPKIFSKLTGRQKIHYGILPLHYLAGLTCLINFLIPILSLFLAKTPWQGNIIDFALVLLPVAASSLLIRTYIQKWVIEKKERGFHLVGGLLHINTWWIYIIGLFYTIINKKVPYLPTPKENEWNTNYKIVLPNATVAILSIAAIVYGLSIDLTPYSLVMAGFALFNAFIMLFGIYLTHRVTNQNRILRSIFNSESISQLWYMKQALVQSANAAFVTTRKIALGLLLLVLILSMNFKTLNDISRWTGVQGTYFQKATNNYLGIFHPQEENAIPDLQEINLLENQHNVNFNIISLYLAWNDQSITSFPREIVDAIYEKNAYPMITWEPWASELPVSDSIPDLKENKKVFKYITEGYFDEYITDFIRILNSYDQPVFLRFAHEFDNPQYPWSTAGSNNPQEFKAAWKYVYNLIKKENGHQVMLVWNPWKADAMEEHYPGDDYIDWIGITMLNYGSLNEDGQYYPFENLYKPFETELSLIPKKPVMLAEFGSLDVEGNQEKWTKDAIDKINTEYREISAVVLFNSEFDRNIPQNDSYSEKYLDWTTGSLNYIASNYKREPVMLNIPIITSPITELAKTPLSTRKIKGVHYKKGKNWKKNYYALTRQELKSDFSRMKEAGINTIQYSGSNIYDYNLLSHAAEYQLEIIYEFEVDKSINFNGSDEALKKLEKEIIEKVNELKDKEQVIAYAFKYDFERYFYKPLLFSQRNSYLNWLSSLTTQIKSIDPDKAIILELVLNEETANTISRFSKLLPIDSFGLITTEDPKNLHLLRELEDAENLSIHISQLFPGALSKHGKLLEEMDIILTNWQDERTSGWLTFDGLIDVYGNKKLNLKSVSNFWTGKEENIDEATIRILKPATPLYPGASPNYRAVIYRNNEWVPASEQEGEIKAEWNLVKTDDYGNPLAIKKLGTGSNISVEIPEDYSNYQLMLTLNYKDEEYVQTTRTTLNTPLATQE